jgi:hypothetical protein
MKSTPRSCYLVVLAAAGLALAAESRGEAPSAIPTFHSLGLYWSPPGGSADRDVAWPGPAAASTTR